MLLMSFFTIQMELPNKLLEQKAFNTKAKKEEHMLIVMDKSTHEKDISRTPQTNKKTI